jgi:hypothetical protein
VHPACFLKNNFVLSLKWWSLINKFNQIWLWTRHQSQSVLVSFYIWLSIGTHICRNLAKSIRFLFLFLFSFSYLLFIIIALGKRGEGIWWQKP